MCELQDRQRQTPFGEMEREGSRSDCESAALWQPLAAICQEGISLSQEVATRLRRGTGGSELVPLLRREAALAEQFCEGIGQLGRRQATLVDPAGRLCLLAQTQKWLDQEQENRALLSRRGIRLSGMRPSRGSPTRM